MKHHWHPEICVSKGLRCLLNITLLFFFIYLSSVLRRSLSEGSLLQEPRSPRFLSDSTIHRLTRPVNFDLNLDPVPQPPCIQTLRKQLTREGGSLRQMLLLLNGTKVEITTDQHRLTEPSTQQWTARKPWHNREQWRPVKTNNSRLQQKVQTTSAVSNINLQKPAEGSRKLQRAEES